MKKLLYFGKIRPYHPTFVSSRVCALLPSGASPQSKEKQEGNKHKLFFSFTSFPPYCLDFEVQRHVNIN